MAVSVLPPEDNFLGLPAEHSRYDSARVVVIQAPYEHTSSYLAGSDRGPAAMVEASRFVEFYDEEMDAEVGFAVGIATLPPLTFGDDEVDERAVDKIEQAVAAALADDKFVVTLGAEHTVSVGPIRAHAARYPGLSILHLDAHSDLRPEYEGNRFSHASALARAAEVAPNLVQVGIRAQAREEAEIIRSSPTIKTIYAHEMFLEPYRGGGGWMQAAIDALGPQVYLTFDCDYFDPSVLPDVGTPVPGGPGWYETLRFLRRVCAERELVGFDVVELAPKEGEIRSPFVAAQLIAKLLAYRFAD